MAAPPAATNCSSAVGRLVARYQVWWSGKVAGSVVATTARSPGAGPYGPARTSSAHHVSACPSRKARTTTDPGPRVQGLPPPRRGGRCLQGAAGPSLLPPAVRGREREHIADPQRVQALAESRILPVEAIGHDRPDGQLSRDRRRHQLPGARQLRTAGGIGLPLGEMVLGRGGRVVQRVVDPRVGPQARHRHHPAVGLTEVGQVLSADMGRLVPPLAVAVLVDDEHPVRVGGRRRVGTQERQPPPVDGVRRPGRRAQEPLPPLCPRVLRPNVRRGVRQAGQGLRDSRGISYPVRLAGCRRTTCPRWGAG